MPASCILSIASAAAAGETGVGFGAIDPPLWSASLALIACAADSSIEQAAIAPPASAVNAVFLRKSRREPFLLSRAAGNFGSSLFCTVVAPLCAEFAKNQTTIERPLTLWWLGGFLRGERGVFCRE